MRKVEESSYLIPRFFTLSGTLGTLISRDGLQFVCVTLVCGSSFINEIEGFGCVESFLLIQAADVYSKLRHEVENRNRFQFSRRIRRMEVRSLA